MNHTHVIIITGGSSGIGKATGELLEKTGCTVIYMARSFGKLTQLRVHAFSLYCDITDPAAVRRSFGKVYRSFRKVDVLIACAGAGQRTIIEDTSYEDMLAQFILGAIGPIYCVKQVLPFMRAQKSGHIIVISSVGGRVTFPTLDFYYAAKHALESLVQSLSWEVRQTEIAVSLIEPGPTKTNFGKHIKDKRQSVFASYYAAAGIGFRNMFKNAQSADTVAATIVRCIEEKKWRYTVSRRDLLWIWSAKLFPKYLYDFMITRYFRLHAQ